MAETSTCPLNTAMPESAMKPIAALTLNGMPRNQRREHPADHREWDGGVDEQDIPQALEAEIQEKEDKGQRDRDDDRKPELGALEVLELPAPFDDIAFRRA